MPVFFQQQINETTRLGIWKIEESEDFFRHNVPQHRNVTHPHKRLQHLAGRFLLRFLFPDFPYELIQIAETRKPFLPNEEYHFSISHCGDYAGAIVSKTQRVGVDVELVKPLAGKLIPKFLSEIEQKMIRPENMLQQASLFWSAKESVFKWYGDGQVDFREHIRLAVPNNTTETMDCFFTKNQTPLTIHYRYFDELVFTWVRS